MLRPIFRIVGSFLAFVGFFAGAAAFQRLIFQTSLDGFFILALQAVVYVLVGLRLRQWAGDLNLVSLDPDQIATHFAIAKAFGLGKHAAAWATFLAGALASAGIVAVVGFLGFITARALMAAFVVFALYGGILGLVKRAYLRKGQLKKHRQGYYAAHRRVSVIAVPLIVIVWSVATLPDATPLLVATIVGGIFFWIGQSYHALWEVLHTALLVLYYGENTEQTIEWGLYEWFFYTRRDATVTSVTYDASEKRVAVSGTFNRPDVFRSDVLKLDFVERVQMADAP